MIAQAAGGDGQVSAFGQSRGQREVEPASIRPDLHESSPGQEFSQFSWREKPLVGWIIEEGDPPELVRDPAEQGMTIGCCQNQAATGV